jgi:hypothetical protein
MNWPFKSSETFGTNTNILQYNSDVLEQGNMSLKLCNTENTTSSSVVFTAPLNRSESYQIVARVFFVTGIYLPSRCPVTGLHVTIWYFNGRLLYLHFSSFQELNGDTQTRADSKVTTFVFSK